MLCEGWERCTGRGRASRKMMRWLPSGSRKLPRREIDLPCFTCRSSIWLEQASRKMNGALSIGARKQPVQLIRASFKTYGKASAMHTERIVFSMKYVINFLTML